MGHQSSGTLQESEETCTWFLKALDVKFAEQDPCLAPVVDVRLAWCSVGFWNFPVGSILETGDIFGTGSRIEHDPWVKLLGMDTVYGWTSYTGLWIHRRRLQLDGLGGVWSWHRGWLTTENAQNGLDQPPQFWTLDSHMMVLCGYVLLRSKGAHG